jgi:hypothetical protein
MNTQNDKQSQTDAQNKSRELFYVAIYLFILSFAIRFPFFFDIVINWDESTFILMGQSILDGHLPYTELWDIKPPLAILFFAGAIALLGKSIVSVRIAGTLCVALTAFFTYLTGKTLWNRRTGILSATLFIVLASSINLGQAVMTEHVALVPLVGALALFVMREQTPRTVFFIGILIAIASFVRINLAFVAVFAGIIIVIAALTARPRQFSYFNSLKSGLAYIAGGSLIVLLVFLPYVITGNERLWWSSVVLAPLSFANSQLSFLEALNKQLEMFWGFFLNIKGSLLGISVIVWLCGFAGLFFGITQLRNMSKDKRFGFLFLIAFLLSIELSILKGGGGGLPFTHYLIQLVPFMSLTASSILCSTKSFNARLIIMGMVLLALITSMPPIITEYEIIISRVLDGLPINHGTAYAVADYIRQHNVNRKPVYMMDDHIVYWLLDLKPLSKSTTHPSNISREYLLKVLVGPGTTTEMELAKIFDKKPLFIVFDNWSMAYISQSKEARNFFIYKLTTLYDPIMSIDDEHICRLKE